MTLVEVDILKLLRSQLAFSSAISISGLLCSFVSYILLFLFAFCSLFPICLANLKLKIDYFVFSWVLSRALVASGYAIYDTLEQASEKAASPRN